MERKRMGHTDWTASQRTVLAYAPAARGGNEQIDRLAGAQQDETRLRKKVQAKGKQTQKGLEPCETEKQLLLFQEAGNNAG
jgi:hypothetical protein